MQWGRKQSSKNHVTIQLGINVCRLSCLFVSLFGFCLFFTTVSQSSVVANSEQFKVITKHLNNKNDSVSYWMFYFPKSQIGPILLVMAAVGFHILVLYWALKLLLLSPKNSIKKIIFESVLVLKPEKFVWF